MKFPVCLRCLTFPNQLLKFVINIHKFKDRMKMNFGEARVVKAKHSCGII